MSSTISIIHPSRGRPEKSYDTIRKWMSNQSGNASFIVSLDVDDPKLNEYTRLHKGVKFVINRNRSCVDAINNAAKVAEGNIFFVVSDDTETISGWDTAILKEVAGKEDWIMKTNDGTQGYIITQTIMDRKYYERDGFIYHPDFKHQFVDTYMTCVADIRGRKITSGLTFRHNHYSVNGEKPDELHRRNDATWQQGEETFVRLMKQFSSADIMKIKDTSMRRWLYNHGIR